MSTEVEQHNGNSDHENNGNNSNIKPELQAIASSIEHIAVELRTGLTALAEALELLVAQPKE